MVANDFGVIDMDEISVGDEWNSGEALTVTLIDQDLNKNSYSGRRSSQSKIQQNPLNPNIDRFGNPVSV